MITPDYSKQIYFILLFLAVIVTGFVMKALGTVMLPVIFASMLSFSFLPLVKKMNTKTRIPWALCSILVTLLEILIILALSGVLVTSLSTIVSQYPNYERKFQSIYQLVAERFGLEFDNSKNFLENAWSSLKIREFVQKFALTLSTGLVSGGKNIFLVFFMQVFLLIEMRGTRTKMNHAFSGKAKERVIRISTNIVQEVVHFLSIKFFISLGTGILVGLGTWAIGLDFPILWGFISFLMNFIPTFGSIISTVFTTLFALLQFYPSIWQTITVFVLMLLANFTLGNILEPRIEGKHLGLSPFVILVSLTLFGWIWGFIGMLLAVPMMVIVKILCENIPYLNAFAVLLGNPGPSSGPSTEPPVTQE